MIGGVNFHKNHFARSQKRSKVRTASVQELITSLRHLGQLGHEPREIVLD